eukprot:scaffold18449_cov27-Tisochrysis_lutea.AAC.2
MQSMNWMCSMPRPSFFMLMAMRTACSALLSGHVMTTECCLRIEWLLPSRTSSRISSSKSLMASGYQSLVSLTSMSCAGIGMWRPFLRMLSAQPSSTSGTARNVPFGSEGHESTTIAMPV